METAGTVSERKGGSDVGPPSVVVRKPHVLRCSPCDERSLPGGFAPSHHPVLDRALAISAAVTGP